MGDVKDGGQILSMQYGTVFWWNSYSGDGRGYSYGFDISLRHNLGCNILFCDWHVERVPGNLVAGVDCNPYD